MDIDFGDFGGGWETAPLLEENTNEVTEMDMGSEKPKVDLSSMTFDPIIPEKKKKKKKSAKAKPEQLEMSAGSLEQSGDMQSSCTKSKPDKKRIGQKEISKKVQLSKKTNKKKAKRVARAIADNEKIENRKEKLEHKSLFKNKWKNLY
eukprot:GCRY01002178.1.p1 GENE.GCRY01002178.1~~GCRY01002178.1.p1  ORF type:complete len:148 (-),score=28.80 GCRY01002178.1:132-575(-)